MYSSGNLHFNDGGAAHAAADAQGSQTLMRTTMLHGVQQGDEDTGTGSADGMAQRNSAAVDVQLALVEVQSLADGNRLSSESLVGLDQIHVVHGQAGLGHDLLVRRWGPGP